jgi:hypothetical protein
MSAHRANSVKFMTLVFVVAGLFLPVWPVSLPLFFYLAYRSFKSGSAAH